MAGELSVTTLDIGGTNVTSTAAELNLIDGGATVGTTAVADGDGIIHNDGGTMRVTSAATFKTYFQEGISTAFDDLSAGDAAVNITTTSGNITIDAAANDSDIIFKGTDGGSDITMLTLDGSEAGKATFNDQVVIGDGKLVLNSTAVTSTAAELNIMDGDTSATSTTLVDADRVVVNDAGTMKQVAFSDVTTFINANANFGESGFTNTTMKVLPGNVDFDLAKSNNTGSAETPFDSSATDAFGVGVGFVFDMQEPVGSSTDDDTDLGTSESHVGA